MVNLVLCVNCLLMYLIEYWEQFRACCRQSSMQGKLLSPFLAEVAEVNRDLNALLLQRMAFLEHLSISAPHHFFRR